MDHYRRHPGGSSSIVQFGWTTADQEAGFDPAAAVSIIHYNGTIWEYIPATVTGSGTIADPYIATATTPVMSFSPFGVVNPNPLPVSFFNVKAYQRNTGVQVEWRSSTEQNLGKYIVERSADGSSFSDAAAVAPMNSNGVVKNYSWFDESPRKGNNFYRIKAIDRDGKFRYTAIMKVAIGEQATDFTISPNLVRTRQLNLQLQNFAKGTYSLELFNLTGQKMAAQQLVHPGGSSSEVIQLPAQLQGGRYYVKMTGDNISLTRAIVFVK